MVLGSGGTRNSRISIAGPLPGGAGAYPGAALSRDGEGFSAEGFLSTLLQGVPDPSPLTETFRSLSRENSPSLFFEGLFQIARQQEQSESGLGLATAIYAAMLNEGRRLPPGLARRARERLDAIEGRGAVLPRLGFHARHFVGHALDPVSIAAMGLAGPVFQVARAATLGRLATSPVGRFLGRTGTRALAGSLAFGAEATAFTGTMRLGNGLMGRGQDWSARGVWHEFAGGAITLLGLKLAGAAAGRAVQRWGQANTPVAGLARAVFPQVGMYSGILASHRLEELLEFRPAAADGSMRYFDALATLFQFHVGGRLAHETVGRHLAGMSRMAEAHAAALSRQRPTPSPLGGEGGGEGWRRFWHQTRRLARQTALFPLALMMGTIGEGGGRRPSPPPPSPAPHHRLRPEIDRHLARLARHAPHEGRYANLHQFNAQVTRLMEKIFPQNPSADPRETFRRHLAADQVHRVLRVWRSGIAFRELGELFQLIENGLEGSNSQSLVEGSVRRFYEDHGGRRRAGPRPVLRPPVRTRPSPSSSTPPPEYTLRDYQEEMILNLARDFCNPEVPWLGIASPMQTGKSFLSGPIIQMLRSGMEPNTRFIILSSARVITDQVMNDLLAGFSPEEVGRFDGSVKEIRPITVASVPSLVRNLDLFTHRGPTVLINDEAYFTQAPSYRTIYQHFGLGEVVREGNHTVLRPRQGNGVVIGLSGTGSGLTGYHISGQLNLLEAIEAGWVRHMRGEREILTIASQQMQGTGGEQMIWWTPSVENAEALADIYDRRIHGTYRKNLVFVPTIRHGELLTAALRRRHGEDYAQAVHSRMEENTFQPIIDRWQREGGALISVRRLSRGFRGTGTDSVFHTYQTSSPELFAQRTGRAWGRGEGEALPDLYVLEAAWSRKSSFATLARVLGLVDCPQREFSSRHLREQVETAQVRRRQRREIRLGVEGGIVAPLFTKIPVLQSWREQFSRLVQPEGGIPDLAAETGLSAEILAGFALGGLPTRLAEVRALQGRLGGEEAAREIWISSWEQALDEVFAGVQRGEGAMAQDLWEWRNQQGESASRAQALDETLARHFHFARTAAVREPRPRWGMQGLLAEVRRRLETDRTDEELLGWVQEEAERLKERYQGHPSYQSYLTVLEKRFLANPPLTPSEIEHAHGIRIDNIRSYTRYMAETIARQIRVRHLLSREELLAVDFGLIFSNYRTRGIFKEHGIQTLGQLISLTERELLKWSGIGPYVLERIQESLREVGLELASPQVGSSPPKASGASEGELPIINQNDLDRDFGGFDLSVRTANCLQNGNIRTVRQLVRMTEEELLRIPNFSRKCLKEINKILAGRGLSLGMAVGEPFQRIHQDELDLDLDEFELSVRTANLLHNANIRTVRQLVRMTESELLRIRHFGRKGVKEIREILGDIRLRLGMTQVELGREMEAQVRAKFDRNLAEVNPNLAPRIWVALERMEIHRVGELVRQERESLQRQLGEDFAEIEKLVQKMGLRLGMDCAAWEPPPSGPPSRIIPLTETFSPEIQQVLGGSLRELGHNDPIVIDKIFPVLRRNDIYTVGDLARLRIEPYGLYHLEPIRRFLAHKGLHLEMSEGELWLLGRRMQAERWALLDRNLEEVGLGLLRRLSLRKVGELAMQSPEVLAQRLNRAELDEVRSSLRGLGLELGMDPLGWTPPPRPALVSLERILDAPINSFYWGVPVSVHFDLKRMGVNQLGKLIQLNETTLRVLSRGHYPVYRILEQLRFLGFHLGMGPEELNPLRDSRNATELLLNWPIETLRIGRHGPLIEAGLRHLGDILPKSTQEISAVRGYGGDSLSSLEEVLSFFGLKLGTDLGQWRPSPPEESPPSPVPQDRRPILDRRIQRTSMSGPAKNSLTQIGILFVGQLVEKRERDLSQLEGMGPVLINLHIVPELLKMGLTLGMDVGDWQPPPEVDTTPFSILLKDPRFARRVSGLTFMALHGRRLRWIGDLVRLSEAELRSIPDLDGDGVQEILTALNEMGLGLEMDVGGWESPGS